jgi:hypothetical protein
MTLLPGDVIACGTSLGVGSMKDGATVEVTIDGIGSLVNRVEAAGSVHVRCAAWGNRDNSERIGEQSWQ